ncbi:hypothetical protein WA158_007645 [Blastocystis sp. Blastoise]
MPHLNSITFKNLYFTKESFQLLLIPFLSSCSELKELTFTRISFTVKDFKRYIDLFSNHIILSTSLSLVDIDTFYDEYKDITVIPKEGIKYLIKRIKQKKLTHLTSINIEYTTIKLKVFKRFITYLTSEYLPQLSQLKIKIKCSHKLIDKVRQSIDKTQLVQINQLIYTVYTKHEHISNRRHIYHHVSSLHELSYSTLSSNDNPNRNTQTRIYPIINRVHTPPLGTIIMGIKRNIDNIEDTTNDNTNSSQNCDDNTYLNKRQISEKSYLFNYGYYK